MEPAVGKLSWIRGSTAEASVVDQPPPDRPSITNFSLQASHESVFIREFKSQKSELSVKFRKELAVKAHYPSVWA